MASIFLYCNIFEAINCETKFADAKVIALSSPSDNESERKCTTKTKKKFYFI